MTDSDTKIMAVLHALGIGARRVFLFRVDGQLEYGFDHEAFGDVEPCQVVELDEELAI